DGDFTGANVLIGQDALTAQTVQTLETITPVIQAPQIIQPEPVRALKVRNITGEIRNITTDVITDKVIIQGIAHLQIFFVLTDNIVHHQAEDIPFSTFIDIPGAVPGMNVEVQPRIEAILHHLSPDGLTLQKKVVLEIFVKVTQFTQVTPEFGTGPLLLLSRVIGEGTQQTLVENLFTLAFPAIKVAEINGEIRNITTDVIADKVIVQGVVHKQIFFVDLDNVSRHQAEDVNFSLFIDIPGASPGHDVEVHPRIEDIIFELVSPTQLRQKVVIEVFVKVTEFVQENVLLGTGPLFKVEQIVGERSKQTLVENVITLERPAEKIHEITGDIRNVTTEVIPDKVIVQGILHKQIFFIGPGGIEFHQGEDVPFSLFIDIPGAEPGQNTHVQFIIEEILFHLENPTTLRQKAIIQATVVVTETVQLNLVLTTGPLFKLMQVVGEGTRQILIVRRQQIPIVPPVPPITAAVTEVTIITPQQVCFTQQSIVENTIQLPEQAIKIREVRAQITGLQARVIADNDILVEGTVHKEVFFVNTANIVRVLNEDVPFSFLVSAPGVTATTPVSVNVDIETILFTLSPDGNTLRQVIVLIAEVCRQVQGQPVTVVSNVEGEGIVEETINIIADVVNPVTGEILPNQTVQVVLNVSGPQVVSVQKTRLVLRVAGNGLVPLDVVTNVVLRSVPVT
ncbi:MAG TPA: DUF3794 domain-containing protein, partial [Bacillota bacterium]|nr:DUF3794 domain-containing protein [Bacillota bacterium]